MHTHRKLSDIKSEILRLGDPWDLVPRTKLWEDGTYTGSGTDLIECRDLIHDLYVLWSGSKSRTTASEKRKENHGRKHQ